MQNKKLQNCKSIYTTTTINFQKYLDYNTIQRLNCVVDCFNVKIVEKFVDILYLQICESARRKVDMLSYILSWIFQC